MRINIWDHLLVVTEDCTVSSCRKGDKAKSLIQSLAKLASHNGVLNVDVPRPRMYQSKYEEAEALVTTYPEMAGHLPVRKRRIFDFEPRSIVLFEALALAQEVINGPPMRVAAVMG